MMHVLAIDTSTVQVSVALGVDGAVIGEVSLVGGRRHAEQLVPAIQYLCDELCVPLDRLATVMAQALRVPVVGVPSLDLLAYPLRHASRLIVTVLDARRREVFYASYRP